MTGRVIALSIVLAGSAAPAAGQRPGLAHLSVRPVPYAVTESTTAFEVFGPPDHLTLDVTLRNEEVRSHTRSPARVL